MFLNIENKLGELLNNQKFIEALAFLDSIQVPLTEVPKLRFLKAQILEITGQINEALIYYSACGFESKQASLAISRILERRGMIDEALIVALRHKSSLTNSEWSVIRWCLSSCAHLFCDLVKSGAF